MKKKEFLLAAPKHRSIIRGGYKLHYTDTSKRVVGYGDII
jgi:hypothetical protein